MKRFIKGIALAAAAAMMAVSAAACGSDTSSKYDLVSSGKIIMGTNAEFPPFEYKEGNAVVGVDAELMQAIARQAGPDP